MVVPMLRWFKCFKGAVINYWGGGGGMQGRYFLKSEGPKVLAPLRLTAQKAWPPTNMWTQKTVALPFDNFLRIQLLHRENPHERDFKTIISLE